MKKTLALRNLILMALLIAVSIILSRYLGFYIDPNSLRISFECVPMMLAGIWLGPVCGMIVGGAADILGSLLSGYGCFLPLTAGPMLIGLISGLMAKYLFKGNLNVLKTILICVISEFIGSLIVGTFALKLYSGAESYFALFIMRLPFKAIIITGDTFIVSLVHKLLYEKAVKSFLKVGART